MYEPAKTCGIKSFSAVKILVTMLLENGYIKPETSIITGIAEICGKHILHLFAIIIPFSLAAVSKGVVKCLHG